MINDKNNVSRRQFIKGSAAGAAMLASGMVAPSVAQSRTIPLRLGGPTFEKYNGPDEWVRVMKKLGYRAAYCPVNARASDDVIKAYERAAKKAQSQKAKAEKKSEKEVAKKETKKASPAKKESKPDKKKSSKKSKKKKAKKKGK